MVTRVESSVTALRIRRSRGIPGERGALDEDGRMSLDSSWGRVASAMAESEMVLSFSGDDLALFSSRANSATPSWASRFLGEREKRFRKSLYVRAAPA